VLNLIIYIRSKVEGKDNMDEYAGECSVLISHVEIQLLWYLIWPNDILKKYLLHPPFGNISIYAVVVYRKCQAAS
jgi:hypothetical protein